MARSAVVPSGSHTHAAAEYAVLSLPASTLHGTLHESNKPAADGGQLVDLVQREHQSAFDAVADEEERGKSRMSRYRPRRQSTRSMSEERIDRDRI